MEPELTWLAAHWIEIGLLLGAGTWSAVVYYELRSVRRNLRLILAFFRSHTHGPKGEIRMSPEAIKFPNSDGGIKPPILR